MEDISIYECKDGRVRVYLKDTQKVMSYPKYLIEKEYGKYGIEVQKNNGVNIGLAKRKLTDEQVKYIRDNYVSGDKEFGCRALARKFGVNKSTINLIINNKTYVNI